MKRVLLFVLILVSMLLSACSIPVNTIPEPTSTPLYALNVNVSPSGAGTVSPLNGEYESGQQVFLNATALNGYTFDYWDGAVSGSSNPVIITMNSDKFTTAHFRATTIPTTTVASVSVAPVNSAKISFTYSGSFTNRIGIGDFPDIPRLGYSYLVLNISINNQGYTSVDLYPGIDFYVVINGVKYSQALVTNLANELPAFVIILDGGTVSGELAFEVPVRSISSNYQVTYEQGTSGTYNIIYLQR